MAINPIPKNGVFSDKIHFILGLNHSLSQNNAGISILMEKKIKKPLTVATYGGNIYNMTANVAL